MTLAELLGSLETIGVEGNLDVTVSGVTDDSRATAAGGVFVAVAGRQADGHAFVGEACRRRAAGVVVQAPFRAPVDIDVRAVEGPAWITVRDSRKALGQLAARFFGHPSRAMTMVGVTGTNGKTTVAHISRTLLMADGRATGLVGTVGSYIGAEYQAASLTTPDAATLQSLLRRMADAGMAAAVVEVSSHALALDRVEGCGFDVAVLTNLTRDHLDFHDDMEQYYLAKARLFRDTTTAGETAAATMTAVDTSAATTSATGEPRLQRAIINVDDAWGRRLATESTAPVWTYSTRHRADVFADHVTLTPEGTRLTVHTPRGTMDVRTSLVGEHNVSNLLAGIGVGLACGMSLEAIRLAVPACQPVPGRFERVDAGQDFSVVVDYAHTEDALARLLTAARHLVGTGRVLTVFGCGGDRDKGKRPKMGRVAARGSDVVFLTSDNPRTEDPAAILRDVERGMTAAAESDTESGVAVAKSAVESGAESGAAVAGFRDGDIDDGGVTAAASKSDTAVAAAVPASTATAHVIPDRRAAIEAALTAARPGDMVLIAGKGHENYQLIGDTRLPFDDRDVARAWLTRHVGVPRKAHK